MKKIINESKYVKKQKINDLASVTTGDYNVYCGQPSGFSLTTGSNNCLYGVPYRKCLESEKDTILPASAK